MEPIIKQLEEHVRNFFHNDSSGHDIHHLERVLNLSLHLQEKEGGDRTIIAVAAFLHDVHRIIQNETKKFCSPKDSLPKVKEILDTTDLSDEQKEKILHCIEFHEEYNFSSAGKTANDTETLILQDADNLDAIGAIGIGRTFSYGGVNGYLMWDPEKPLGRDVYDEGEDDPTTVHHIHAKLMKLKNNMNTKTAKQMAQSRHEFMETFVAEFFSEWKGEK